MHMRGLVRVSEPEQVMRESTWREHPLHVQCGESEPKQFEKCVHRWGQPRGRRATFKQGEDINHVGEETEAMTGD